MYKFIPHKLNYHKIKIYPYDRRYIAIVSLGSCNHIAGLLFRLEVANLMGATRKTCTSQLCQFVVPSSSKKKVVPGKLSSFLIQNENYSKLVTSDSKDVAKSKLKRKLEYLPMSNSGKVIVSDQAKMRSKFYEAFKSIIPNSCFIQLVEGKSSCNIPSETINSTTCEPIFTLLEQAELFKKQNNSSVKAFLNSIKLSNNQIRIIYQKKTSQSSSPFWLEQRKGRITASIFKKVYTRMNTLKEKPDDPTPLLQEIMGEKTKKRTWEMNHGLSAERHAKIRYKKIIRIKHKGIKFQEPGMTVYDSEPFIECTPDLEMACECCGEGVCEIKCPPSVPSDRAPSNKTYGKHLEKRDGKIKLKKNSEYYFQIQGQMAVTKRCYGDFFVFNIANRSFHLERIEFDSSFWENVLSNLKLFWHNYVLPYLLLIKVPIKKLDETTSQNSQTDPKLVYEIVNQEKIDLEII